MLYSVSFTGSVGSDNFTSNVDVAPNAEKLYGFASVASVMYFAETKEEEWLALEDSWGDSAEFV